MRRFGVQGRVIALLLILTTNCCIPFQSHRLANAYCYYCGSLNFIHSGRRFSTYSTYTSRFIDQTTMYKAKGHPSNSMLWATLQPSVCPTHEHVQCCLSSSNIPFLAPKRSLSLQYGTTGMRYVQASANYHLASRDVTSDRSIASRARVRGLHIHTYHLALHLLGSGRQSISEKTHLKRK